MLSRRIPAVQLRLNAQLEQKVMNRIANPVDTDYVVEKCAGGDWFDTTHDLVVLP
jgi:hypothetical protein